ncbi:MAG: hypothetical protein K2X93_04880 [Candidatus Obscuribacterales bacterium]|nr:hypothetical protein [Candidatus Obscuribacterales bacterium]
MLEVVPQTTNQPPQDGGAPVVDKSRVRLWQTHCDDAVRFLEEGQHRKARQKFRSALKEATRFGESDERLASTLLNLLACEIELKDGELSREEALELIALSLRVHLNCYGKESEDTASCMLNVGILLEAYDQFYQANSSIEQAIAILRSVETQSPRWSTLLCHSLFNRAALIWSSEQLRPKREEALSLAEESYKLAVELYGIGDDLVDAIRSLRDSISSSIEDDAEFEPETFTLF